MHKKIWNVSPNVEYILFYNMNNEPLKLITLRDRISDCKHEPLNENCFTLQLYAVEHCLKNWEQKTKAKREIYDAHSKQMRNVWNC